MPKTNSYYLSPPGLLILLLLCQPGNAQESGEGQWGFWWKYFDARKLSERYASHTEAKFGDCETWDNFNQLLQHLGLSYPINSEAIAPGAWVSPQFS